MHLFGHCQISLFLKILMLLQKAYFMFTQHNFLY